MHTVHAEAWEMKRIGILLLAAGAGKRFGGNKLEALVHGKPMFLHALDLVEKQNVLQKVVVTGKKKIALEAEKREIKVAWNESPEKGISYSIRLGMETLLEAEPMLDAVLFMVCDQPWLQYETIKDLIHAHACGIMAVSHHGKSGNPVIFSKKYFYELMHLSGDVGGRQVMNHHKEEVYYLKVFNKKELEDIDLREQLEE